jgi:hypothetical protein
MAAAAKKKVEYCDDGVTRKLDRDRPYGTVYADGYEEAKFVQDEICYRGDGVPCGYVPAEKRGLVAVEPTLEEALTENEALKRQLAAVISRLEKLEGKEAKPAAAQATPAPRKEPPNAGVSARP